MSEISPEKRQQAKAAAANAAVASNNTAVVLGVSGVVVAGAGAASGVGALAGVGVGAALAVCSFGAWLIGNRYQRLANDPLRSDFDQVSESFARLNEELVPLDEPQATLHRFAAHQVILSDSLSALVISLERHDGARDANDLNAANRQVEAVRHNAQSAAGQHDILAELASAINQVWGDSQEFLDWDSVSLEEVQQLYLSACGPPSRTLGEPLQAVLASVIDLADSDLFTSLDANMDPVLSLLEIPAGPQMLVDETYVDTLGSLSEFLRDLVIDTN